MKTILNFKNLMNCNKAYSNFIFFLMMIVGIFVFYKMGKNIGEAAYYISTK